MDTNGAKKENERKTETDDEEEEEWGRERATQNDTGSRRDSPELLLNDSSFKYGHSASLNQLPRLNCGCWPRRSLAGRLRPEAFPSFQPDNLGIIPSYKPSPSPPLHRRVNWNVSGKIKNDSVRAPTIHTVLYTHVFCVSVSRARPAWHPSIDARFTRVPQTHFAEPVDDTITGRRPGMAPRSSRGRMFPRKYNWCYF